VLQSSNEETNWKESSRGTLSGSNAIDGFPELTSIGELLADRAVKPTISLKYIVTHSYCSGTTGQFFFNCSATDLQKEVGFNQIPD
jgi:hypothetical protein